jgi:hypothetical protein
VAFKADDCTHNQVLIAPQVLCCQSANFSIIPNFIWTSNHCQHQPYGTLTPEDFTFEHFPRIPSPHYFTFCSLGRSHGFCFDKVSSYEINSDTIDNFEWSWKLDSIDILFSRWPANDQRI